MKLLQSKKYRKDIKERNKKQTKYIKQKPNKKLKEAKQTAKNHATHFL